MIFVGTSIVFGITGFFGISGLAWLLAGFVGGLAAAGFIEAGWDMAGRGGSAGVAGVARGVAAGAGLDGAGAAAFRVLAGGGVGAAWGTGLMAAFGDGAALPDVLPGGLLTGFDGALATGLAAAFTGALTAGLLALPVGFAAVLAIGLATGLATGLAADFASGFAAALATGRATGFATGLAVGLAAGLLADFAAGLAAGFTPGLAAAFAITLPVGRGGGLGRRAGVEALLGTVRTLLRSVGWAEIGEVATRDASPVTDHRTGAPGRTAAAGTSAMSLTYHKNPRPSPCAAPRPVQPGSAPPGSGQSGPLNRAPA